MRAPTHVLVLPLAACALVLSCSSDSSNGPSANGSSLLDNDGPAIVYSVQFEWGSELHLIAGGDDHRLFAGDTIGRAWPSLDRVGERIAYVKGGVSYPMYGWSGNPALVVADVNSQTESVVLPAGEGVRYWYPVWTGLGTVAVYRTSGDTSEVLVVQPSGAVVHRMPIGHVGPSDGPQVNEVPGRVGLVALHWADTTAILDAAAGELRGVAGGFLWSLAGRPMCLGDSMYLQSGYANPTYRVYSLSSFGHVDRNFAVDIRVVEDDTTWHFDSAYVVWMDDSTRIVYERPSSEYQQVLICDASWRLRGIRSTLAVEYFLALCQGRDLYYVTQLPADNAFVVVRHEVGDGFGSDNAYEILSLVRDNHFILDARICP